MMKDKTVSLRRKVVLKETYQIKKVLSISELSIVYMANHIESGEMVAVKEFYPRALALRDLDRRTVLCKQPSVRSQYHALEQSFLQEAELLSELKHPNIVAYLDHFEEYGTHYIVMEYCKGTSLDQYIRAEGTRLSSGLLSHTMLSLINALEFTHKKGIIHRDLKPGNVIVALDGTPKLIDFGSAVRVQTEGKPEYSIFTTAGYSPLELYSEKSKQDKQVDLYSFAAILYFCLSGQAPMDVKQRLFQDDLTPIRMHNRRVSPMLGRVIHWGLAVKTDDRCSSFQWFRRVIRMEAVMWRGKARIRPNRMVQ